jgi:hypothetical protein
MDTHFEKITKEVVDRTPIDSPWRPILAFGLSPGHGLLFMRDACPTPPAGVPKYDHLLVIAGDISGGGADAFRGLMPVIRDSGAVVITACNLMPAITRKATELALKHRITVLIDAAPTQLESWLSATDWMRGLGIDVTVFRPSFFDAPGRLQ